MKDRLFIRLLADQESVEWGLINSQESTVNFLDRGNLLLDDIVALAEMASNNPVTLLLPAEKVRNFKVDAPTRNRKHLEKAVPYLLEEQVIESVDSQHFALGNVDSNNCLTVNVVSKKYLANLLDRFSASGVEIDEVFTDASVLPVFDDSWTMLDTEPALVRQDADTFWSAPQAMVNDLLAWNVNELIEEEQSITQAIRVFSVKEQATQVQSVAGLAVQPMPIDDELVWLASQDTSKSINLLQQEFATTKKSATDSGRWKLPMLAASVLLISGLAYFISDLFILNNEKSYFEQQALAEVQKLSPNTDEGKLQSKITEINRLYSKASGGSGNLTGFVALLDKVYRKIKPQELKLEQLDFNAKQGTLNLDVKAKEYQLLTSTQQQLEKEGLKVEMRNARENNGNWTTRLVVKVN